MTHRAFALAIASVFIFGCAASPSATNDAVRDYPVDRVAARTYVIHGPLGIFSVANQGFMNNPGFVVTGEGVVVIDPGSSLQAGRMVMKQIRKLTDQPVTHVFNTHVHGDHWLGNHAVLEAYPNAVLLAHPETVKRAPGAAEDWLSLIRKLTDGFTAGTRAAVPTVGIGNGAELKTGGMDVPHPCARSIEACRIAARLNARHYVPGHGPTGDVTLVKAYESYLTTLYTEARKHYDAGRSDFEMKDAVVAKLAPYAAWANFDDVVGKHISLAILEIEREQ